MFERLNKKSKRGQEGQGANSCQGILNRVEKNQVFVALNVINLSFVIFAIKSTIDEKLTCLIVATAVVLWS